MSLSTIRHDEIFLARENNQRITIIGAGATGSRVFAALVELGLTNLTIVDYDEVEPHNLANQMYLAEHVGTPKVSAMCDWTRKKLGYVPNTMHFVQGAAPQDAEIRGTVFLLTDTMASRKEIFEAALKDNPEVYRVIETRMASTHGNVYFFDPNDPASYSAWEDTLSDDEETEVSHCGSSISVGPTASIIANLAVWQFMLRKMDPASTDDVVDIFLRPFCTHSRNYS